MAVFIRSSFGVSGAEVSLPVQFKYRILRPKRTSYAPSLDSGVHQSKDRVDQDVTIEWEIPNSSKASYDVLRTYYDTADDPDYLFVGHHDRDDQLYIVKFTALVYVIQEGLYQISGQFRAIWHG